MRWYNKMYLGKSIQGKKFYCQSGFKRVYYNKIVG